MMSAICVAGRIALTVLGKDAFCNPCSLQADQVGASCHPEAALQQLQIREGEQPHEVVLTADVTSQGTDQALLLQGMIKPRRLPFL